MEASRHRKELVILCGWDNRPPKSKSRIPYPKSRIPNPYPKSQIRISNPYLKSGISATGGRGLRFLEAALKQSDQLGEHTLAVFDGTFGADY